MHRLLLSALAAPALLAMGCSPTATSTMSSTAGPAGSTAVDTTSAEFVPRVLVIGDSTLLAVESYGRLDAFTGFDLVFDAASCRTIGVPSCGDEPVPSNALDVINTASGSFDAVVLMAGYDEWWTSFPASFDRAVEAARRRGADYVVWLLFPENVAYEGPNAPVANEAFEHNNETLRAKTAERGNDDVILADWPGYSARYASRWITDDGIHLTPIGSVAVADYMSRYVAALFGLPCPMPRTPGGKPEAPCGNPDDDGPVEELEALYG